MTPTKDFLETKAYQSYKEWQKISDNEDLNIFGKDERVLFSFFDRHNIHVIPEVCIERGSNVWRVHVICDWKKKYNMYSEFESRREAEQKGFDEAFILLNEILK